MKRIVSVLLVLLFAFALPFSARAAAPPTAGQVKTQSGRLNVRAAPGGSIVTALERNSYVTLYETADGWRKVEYAKGQYGYCSETYLEEVSTQSATVKLTSGWLNVRGGAGTSYAVTHTLQNQSSVLILNESNGWSLILFDGTATGWVSSRYLVKDARASYAAVSLKVPNYKQTDDRWKNTKLGATNYTIGAIGCTTTALAMTESFRTGKTVTPDAMAKTLKYTDTGSLYWPNNYVYLTQTDGWAEQIYALLKQGKPVIVGAKKASGTQHWVVVTGCYGVKTLSAAAFKINDPGSATRTSLSQFFSTYPYLYKIVWYTE